MNTYPANYIDAGEVQIDAATYRIVRQQDKQAYIRGYANEPPFDQGAPPMVSNPYISWHLGGFKSRSGFPNTSEYGRNSDGRWPGRLLPGPLIHDIALAGSNDSPRSIFEAFGRVYVVTTSRVYSINPATDAVTVERDFGADVPIMGLFWENGEVLVTVLTGGTVTQLWRQLALGGAFTLSATVTKAWLIAAGINRLFRISSSGELANISTGSDPMVDTNWADSVQMGNKVSATPQSLVAYNRSVIATKPDGVFGAGEEGFGIPLIKRIISDPYGGHGAINFDPYVLVPHPRGLYRYQPGQATMAGIEVEVMSQSPVKGRIWALATDGNTVYASLCVDSGLQTDHYLLAGRERRITSGSQQWNETAFGPFIWDTLAYRAWSADGSNFESFAMWISNLSTTPRVYFGHGKNLSYIKLSASGGAPDVNGSDIDYAPTGSRYLPWDNFQDWGEKDFPKVVVVTRNCNLTNYWQLWYDIDHSGVFSTNDISGIPMIANANGRQTFVLHPSAHGREIQWRLDHVYSGGLLPPEVVEFEPFAIVNPRNVAMITFQLQLEAGIRYERSQESRSAQQQYADLYAVFNSATAVLVKGPWSSEDDSANYAFIQDLKVSDAREVGYGEQRMLVEIRLQLRPPL